MIRTLISLSENDKRMIFALLLIILLILALLGYICYLLVKLMKWQGKKMDSLIHDVVVTGVIKDRKHLIDYGRKKNFALFFKQSYIPLLIVIFGLIIWIIKCSLIGNFSYNPFNTYDGFGTIFWTWKLSGDYTEGTIIRFAKLVVDNTPHMVAEAWAGYIACPCFLAGGLWYFLTVTSLVGRTIKLEKRSREVFEKSLDGFNQNEALNNNVNKNSANEN